MNKNRVESRAYRLLTECGISDAPVNLEPIAAHVGATIRLEPFDGDDLSGMVFKHQGQIFVGINSNHGTNRQRFTLAHEIAHIVLHSLDQVHIDKQFPVKLRDDKSSQAVDPHEIEANAFAAALLMPEAMLKRDLADFDESGWGSDWKIPIGQLAKKYQVSDMAMTFRLANLGLVNPVSL